MAISANQVKDLREKTGAGVMECKRALEQADGNLDKAVAILREQGMASVAKRADRQASQGVVETYVHGGGRIGVIVEVNCETDFVANTPEFRQLARDVAMQIAAMNPVSLSDEDAPADRLPDQLPLLSQPFIRDSGRTIADLVRDTAATTKENVVIRRFTRYELGA